MQQRSKSKWLQKAFVFLLAITIVATYSLPQSFGMFGAQKAKAAGQPVPVNDTYDGVDWEITADNVLKIGKEGETQTFANRVNRNETSWPWWEYRAQITSVDFVGKVVGQGSFRGMFYTYKKIKKIDNLSNVNTAGVTNMYGTFWGTSVEELDLTSWDTSSVVFMRELFRENSKLKTIKGIENFNTANVTNMYGMFDRCTNLELPADLTNWDVSNVENMYGLFYGTSTKELDITGWDTGKVTNMSYMFAQNQKLTEIKGIKDIDTSSVTNMSYMFAFCSKLKLPEDLTGWDVSKVGTGGSEGNEGIMYYMFYGTATEKIDITGWDTSNVKSMSHMFATNPELTEIKGIKDIDTSSVTNMAYMFSNCPKLKLPEDFTGWDVSKVGTGGAYGDAGHTGYMFHNTATEKLDITGWDTSNIKNMAAMFATNRELTEIKGIGEIDTSNVTHMDHMFSNCPKLNITESLADWDVSKVGTGGALENEGNMNHMFYGTATEIFDIAGWDTSNVRGMGNMFANNPELTEIKGIEDIDTGNVTDMGGMFANDPKLKPLDIGSWDVSKVGTGGIDENVGTMNNMFNGCKALEELDLKDWDTSNVRGMAGMFANTNLETIDVSPLETSNVEDMRNMFSDNPMLTEIKGIEDMDTSKVTNMAEMFARDPLLNKLDVSNFDTDKVENMKNMFQGDFRLEDPSVLAIEPGAVTDTQDMYKDCDALLKKAEDILDKENLPSYPPATQALINKALDEIKDAVENGEEFTPEKLVQMEKDFKDAAGQIADDCYEKARDAFSDTIKAKEQDAADDAAAKADSSIDAAQGSLNDAKAKAPQGGQPAIDAVKKAQTDAGKAVDDTKASKAAADEALKKAKERAAAMEKAVEVAKAAGDPAKIRRAENLKEDADKDLKDAQAAAEASEKAAEKAIEDAEKIKQEADKLAAEILADEAAKQADTAKKEADDAKKKAEEAKTSGDAQKAKDDAQKAKADADKAAKTAKDAQDAAKDALDGAKGDLNKVKEELLAAEEELEKATKDLEDAIDSGSPDDIREARAKLDEAEDKVDALKEKEKAAEDNVKECEEIAKKADDAAKKAAEAQKAAEDALKAADGALDKLKAKEELDKLLADAAKVDQSKYTPDTAKKFNDAINAGKKTSANPSSTPQQLNAAKDALNSAWRGLMPKDLDEARKNLDSKIGTAEKINQDIYTPATAKKLQDAILSGKKVLANPSATVAQVNAAAKAVDDAVAGLKKKPDPNKPVNLLTTSPVGKTVSALDSSLAKLKSDKDIKGSAFGLLKARGQAKGKNGLKLNWSKAKGTSKFIVYGNKCGKYNSYKKLKTTKAKSFSPKKILKKKLKKNTYYKMMIVAVDKSNKVVAVSKTIHVATNGGKKGNDKSLKVTSPKNRKLSLKKGAGKKIKVKEVKAKKKKVARHRKVAFESSNPNVATVSSKGKVTAKAKGKATIYAYAQNGVFKTVKVTVK